jgi:Tol biopolymer transport system component
MFAFGGVLHEMVTGQRAFTGPSQTRLIAAILEREPEPLSKLQPRTPPALERVVSRCLAKDPENRWQSASDLAAELKWIAEGGSSPGVGTASTPTHAPGKAWLPWLTALLLAGGFIYALRSRRPAAVKPVVARYQIAPPSGTALFPAGRPALSPQGTRVAFTGISRGGSGLFVRDLSTLVTTKVEGSDGGIFPFWSPDGRRIGFVSAGKLKVADLEAGAVQTLCDADGGGGAAWSSADVIVLFTLAGDLVRASPRGGRCSPVPNPNPERRHDPAFFPDGRHFSYHAVPKGSGGGRPSVYVGSLDSDDRRLLLEDAYGASYSSTGHLLFEKAGVLMGRPFDAKRLEFTGDAFVVSRQVALTPRTEDRPTYSASANGVLAWQAGIPATDRLQLTWFDRQGRRLGTLGEVGDYSAPALSRDGRSLAVGRRDPETRTRDLWIFDLERGTSRRLTFSPADEVGPAWSPDGKWVVFSSDQGGSRQLYRKPVNGAESEEQLTKDTGGGQFVEDWSPDGALILQNRWEQGVQPNLFLRPVSSGGAGEPIVFRNTTFAEHMAQFSPDGRWIAYTSSESGREEAYVGRVPGAGRPDGKWLVSTSGGLEPRWRGDGREIYYVSGTTLMAVDVRADGDTFKAGQPQPLFDVTLAEPRRNRFVVTRDGQRFLVNSALTQSGEQIDVLVNWMP